MYGIDKVSPSGATVDLTSFSNVRYLGKYEPNFTSAGTKTFDMSSLLPSEFTFDSAKHEYLVFPVGGGNFNTSYYSVSATVKVSSTQTGSVDYTRSDTLNNSINKVRKTPSHSISGSTLTVTSQSFNTSVDFDTCAAMSNEFPLTLTFASIPGYFVGFTITLTLESCSGPNSISASGIEDSDYVVLLKEV